MNTDFLITLPLFGGIKTQNMEKIKHLLKKESYAIGEDIIKEGETGNKLYIILKGSVEILKKDPLNKQEHQIAILKKGDNFGEMELIDIQARVATVRTMTKTTVCSLSNKDLYSIEKWDSQSFILIIMNLAREISRRLRKMDNILAHLTITINSTDL